VKVMEMAEIHPAMADPALDFEARLSQSINYHCYAHYTRE